MLLICVSDVYSLFCNIQINFGANESVVMPIYEVRDHELQIVYQDILAETDSKDTGSFQGVSRSR